MYAHTPMKITKRNENKNNLPSVRDEFPAIFSLRDAMDKLFEESFWSPFGLLDSNNSKSLATFAPRVDISETENEIKVRADIPGIDPEKVNIEVTEETLAISGSQEKSEEEKGENYYRMERQWGEFSREFMLPAKIDPNSVEAKAKNGVITIILKKQPSEKKKKVPVSS
ncbi:MAG TPA: Hsp20/alpha crystallin family protein [Candidatus Paceibacterota bacterium]|jgi:HSP20 family protein|nr:Hsp20/alpha crystallin family protein [Candidatus Pacearchaeota archaeon]HPC30812.1 Hsp20/alpha crystallin family protein [Candidatus Pacearchaeota archaeon]HQG09125.1 Hsp20/alpha crystallin family protein [Candidatus Pacearchaeota archaeon]HRR94877.1 Hsp20/alpha crystallin family protein [Candidatus Paceibacterota bacterium]HRU20990.1 Hsp20/alpha crystallin family protein [Candidatus Paceibacterota bacterium]